MILTLGFILDFLITLGDLEVIVEGLGEPVDQLQHGEEADTREEAPEATEASDDGEPGVGPGPDLGHGVVLVHDKAQLPAGLTGARASGHVMDHPDPRPLLALAAYISLLQTNSVPLPGHPHRSAGAL